MAAKQSLAQAQSKARTTFAGRALIVATSVVGPLLFELPRTGERRREPQIAALWPQL
jgi:hypothetical protein